MKLLRKMTALQKERGALGDDILKNLSREEQTPLYHLEGLRGFYPTFRKTSSGRPLVQVCRDISCKMRNGSDGLESWERVREALEGKAEVEPVSCLGRCDSAPAALLEEVPVRGVAEELIALLEGTAPLPPNTPTSSPRAWPTDPCSSPDNHYTLLKAVLQESADLTREAIPERLKASGLRGMGGAGFPTGLKWELTAAEKADTKYVICNADESEPGTFKDRVILEELPHLVIEAMTLAGLVIGAQEGIIYLRHEYHREKRALEQALERAEKQGWLGERIGGTEFSFRIEIFVSPGGYILGEETALLEALEDQRGEPRNKPPFPTRAGLHGKPTLINNVETFAAVPAILTNGPDWWQAQGRGDAAGLKFFSVSGDVAQPGVVCLPMGCSAKEVLEACGGMTGNQPLLAFAPGGASSRLLPASRLDVAMDFQSLQAAGSMLGSGAVIFIAEGRDLLELALNEVRFFRNESCGKCVPCRVGSQKAVEMIEQALAGNPPDDLETTLRELGETMTRTSICGLGQVALQPILSVMDHFPPEAARLFGKGGKS